MGDVLPLKCDRFLVEAEAKVSDNMKQSRFNEKQFSAILKEQEAGVAMVDVWLRSLPKSLSCMADEPHRADEEQDGARGGQVGQPIHPARLAADVGDRLNQLNRCAK